MNAPLPLPASPAPAIVGTLAVRRFGAGRPLVLLHGGSGSHTHWIANIDRLAQGFEVVALDLPGYGDAPRPASRDPETYIGSLAEDLAAAMADAGPFGLVGFSFGGTLAAALAARLPGSQVSALTLLGPGGFGVPEGRRLPIVPTPSAAQDPAGHRAAVAQNLGAFMMSRVPAVDEAVVDLHSANIARQRFDSRVISLADRLTGDLARVHCPLQVIWGAKDQLCVPSVAHRAGLVRAVQPDAEIHILPGAGHFVQYEVPDAVAALIETFHHQAFSNRVPS
ncbi:alpha/beta fold hydrolase [Xanthobacter tagetidis]|uniref:Alpha/beta fold hydrolase n=1 Tax=Xanthobacter tagetidis TaxID=60216 RepID=A0A3L6ZZ79_9HYPH|nr:alpha/beta fold hydrolase [Xanthobacter tagetidis]MBB6307119.1 pimeloyl-ACP methyl ester carboxylesterase [Xanthobacter tagetidis]RLP73239.1 alpha/beta fold hydrolase [Xanthobacter tagetidis]